MPNSRPYNVQAPACCKHLKCLNDRPVKWSQVTLIGTGGTSSPTNAGLELISNANGLIEVQDGSALIDPNRNFEFIATAQNKSGPGYVAVGLSDNDTSTPQFLLVTIYGSNITVIWGKSGTSTTNNLHITPNREVTTYRVIKKGSKLRVEIPGVTTQEFTLDNKFPTSKINPAIFVGDAGSASTDAVLAAFCAGKI